MIITINGQDADITLENEKTIKDVLAGVETWLSGSGHRLSALRIDGEQISAGDLENFFGRDIESIHTLDLMTSSWADLAAEALLNIRRDIDDYLRAGFGERGGFKALWEERPEAQYLCSYFPDLYIHAAKTFSGEGLSPGEFGALIDERLRELENPGGELAKMAPLIEEVSVRLEDLPLDVQTGKDSRAAETVQIFSYTAEKIFRIVTLLEAEGFGVKALTVETMPVYNYIEEFGTALKEMLAAYEAKDVVLVGDLAEYELAPRLRGLYAGLKAVPGASA
jgi:hypothetical protein